MEDVVVMVVHLAHLDGAIAARVRWRGFDDDGFAGLYARELAA